MTHVDITPRPTTESFTTWNEAMSQKYNPDHYHNSCNAFVRWIERRRAKALIQELRIEPESDVLDVGCGAGNMLQILPPCRRKIGVDLSPTMIERATRKLGEGAELRLMPAEALDFPDASFDRILCSEVLEHTLEPRRVLREMWRVLKPVGFAAASIPNEHLIENSKRLLHAFRLQRLLRNDGKTNLDAGENEWHLHHGSIPAFRAWNEGLFHLEKIIPIPGWWYPVRYVFLLRKS